MQQEKTIIGFDAKRIVRNGTGLGSYGRTLVNDLQRDNDGRFSFRLYAPDKGRDDLRSQIADNPDVQFVYPEGLKFRFQKDLWRTKGIVKDLQRDGVRIFHGLSGELPRGLQRGGHQERGDHPRPDFHAPSRILQLDRYQDIYL
jgi:hypothetical protein